MRCCVKSLFAAVVVLLLFSCQVKMPEGVLAPDRMEDVLYDYHLAQSMTGTIASADYKEKLMFTYVYDKHGISKAQFDSSLVWYNRYPKHMRFIYENLEARVQSDIDNLGGTSSLLEEGVAIEVANLVPNIAELWTSHNVKMLSATPLGNTVNFSFNTPSGAGFQPNDSLVFSFNAVLIPEDEGAVKHEAYAAINLTYDNSSQNAAWVTIRESGHYALTVPRNEDSRLKSMSGYLFYLNNDTTNKARMILSDISVKRYRAKKKSNQQNSAK